MILAAEHFEFGHAPPIRIPIGVHPEGHRALRITRAEPYLAALVRDPMADRLPGMLAQAELPSDDVQLEDRGSAMRPHLAVDLHVADHFIGAQSLIGLDKHRIRLSR